MKAFLTWSCLIICLGIGLSIYLFPKKPEVALIDLKSGRYQDVQQYYQDQYAKGDRTPALLVAYSELEESQGNIDCAIDLIMEYHHLYPDDFSALQRLGDLYVTNQQYDHYFQTLLELAKVHPDAKVFGDLADWYGTEDDYESLFPILQQLVKLDHADEGNLLDLANLYAERKKYNEGLTLLEIRRKIFFKDVTINDVFFELWLLEKMGSEREKEIDLLSVFLLEKNNPEITFNAINQVNDQYPKLIFPLIDRIDPLIKNHPILESAVCEIKWDRSVDQKAVYEKLLALYAAKQIHPQLQNLLFNIELQKGQTNRLIDLIRSTPSENFTARNIIFLSTFALEQNQPLLAQEMQKTLGQSYLKNNPVIAAALAMAARDENAGRQFDTALKSTVPVERYELFQVAVAANLEPAALRLGCSLFPFIGMSDDKLLDIAIGYIHFKKENELMPLLEGNENAKVAKIFLDIHGGYTQNAANEIAQEKNLLEFVQQIYFTEAEEKKEFPLALFLAKRMKADFPTPANEANYALALIQVGKEKQGIALLKELFLKHPNDEGIENSYFDSLVFLAKRHPAYYQDDLRTFIEQKEPTASSDLLRQFADAYINPLKDFSKASLILQHLSEKTPPNFSDIQSLVYLWGPKPSPENINWLEKKAEQSTSKDLGFWLQGLNQVSDFDFIIQTFSNHWTEDVSSDAFFAYMDALTIRKRSIELQNAIRWGVIHFHTPDELQKLGTYAQRADLRREIYQRLVDQRPDDLDAWRQIGKAAYEQHDDARTLQAIDQFFSLAMQEIDGCAEKTWTYPDVTILSKNLCRLADVPFLYESLYEYGDVLEKQRRYDLSKQYFEMALNLIKKAPEKTYSMMEIQSLIDYKITSHTAALNEMHDLYEMSSHDPSVSASYANMLMDAGNLLAPGVGIGEDCK